MYNDQKNFILSNIVLCNSEKKNGDENIKVVKKYIEAVQNKDVKTMTDLLADDYIGYGPSFSDSITKTEAESNWKHLSTNVYDKIEYKKMINVAVHVSEGSHPGDYVTNWAELSIKHIGDPKTIQIFANTYYRIENGKITLSRTIYNEADALRQMGYQFVPGN
jgi:ketosteroid isomerase-like protein